MHYKYVGLLSVVIVYKIVTHTILCV